MHSAVVVVGDPLTPALSRAQGRLGGGGGGAGGQEAAQEEMGQNRALVHGDNVWTLEHLYCNCS